MTTLTDRTMRAVLQDRYGTAEVLRLGRVPRPVIGEHDVLVEVHAAGLDRGTEHLMTGKPYAMRLAFGMTRPKNPVPGRDVAGTVVDVGAAVTRFAVGDELYGVAPGSFAEYAVARESRLARKPANLSFTQAAVVPVSAATALRALSWRRSTGATRAGNGITRSSCWSPARAARRRRQATGVRVSAGFRDRAIPGGVRGVVPTACCQQQHQAHGGRHAAHPSSSRRHGCLASHVGPGFQAHPAAHPRR